MIHTARTLIEVMSKEHAPALLHYHVENREHLRPWQPERPDSYFTLENWVQLGEASELAFAKEHAVKLVALARVDRRVIGLCNFTGISRGAFQACFLGYSVAQSHQGQGYMSEILEAAIDYMFNPFGLNRIMATYMPTNIASEKVLAKQGFEREGYARKYLKIAGVWEDHILTSKLNES